MSWIYVKKNNYRRLPLKWISVLTGLNNLCMKIKNVLRFKIYAASRRHSSLHQKDILYLFSTFLLMVCENLKNRRILKIYFLEFYTCCFNTLFYPKFCLAGLTPVRLVLLRWKSNISFCLRYYNLTFSPKSMTGVNDQNKEKTWWLDLTLTFYTFLFWYVNYILILRNSWIDYFSL